MYQCGTLFGSMTLLVTAPLEEYTDLDHDQMNLISEMKLELVGLENFATHLPRRDAEARRARAGNGADPVLSRRAIGGAGSDQRGGASTR